MAADLVVQRPEGLYCPPGDFHIDPWRPVPRAVITHAHADHARRGHGAYLAASAGAGVLRLRLGGISLQALSYGEVVDLGGVRLSLHPAGHVLGSAQVRLEHRGQVWVVSGDYFHSGAGDTNPTCEAFEPLRCHCFVTESTFALPVYRWRPQAAVLTDLNRWWSANADAGRPSVLLAYSFGKAQRVLAGVEARIGPLLVHDNVAAANEVCRAAGMRLPECGRLTDALERGDASAWRRALIVTPPGTQGAAAWRQLGERREALASGWMQLRSARSRRGAAQGFVLSDHADWPGLLAAIAATEASRVIVTHGEEAALVRVLQQQGLQAGTFDRADRRSAAGPIE